MKVVKNGYIRIVDDSDIENLSDYVPTGKLNGNVLEISLNSIIGCKINGFFDENDFIRFIAICEDSDIVAVYYGECVLFTSLISVSAGEILSGEIKLSIDGKLHNVKEETTTM